MATATEAKDSSTGGATTRRPIFRSFEYRVDLVNETVDQMPVLERPTFLDRALHAYTAINDFKGDFPESVVA